MDFNKALAFVLAKEGGYSNDPTDRGGETNFGISSKANPGVDIKNLTKEGAGAIYKAKYWDAIGADSLPAGLRLAAFDAAVQHGVGTAKRLIEQAGGDVAKLIGARKALYANLIERDPSQKKFEKGWANRIQAVAAAAGAPEGVQEEPAKAAPGPVAASEDTGGDPRIDRSEWKAPAPATKPAAAVPSMAEFHDAMRVGAADLGSAAIRASGERLAAPQPDIKAQQEVALAEAEKRQDVGFGDAVNTALEDPDVISFRVMDLIANPRGVDEWPRGTSYLDHREEVEKGMSAQEVEFMHENAVSGPAAMRRARAEVLLARDRNAVYSDAGDMNSLLGQMTGGLADPVAAAAGMGIGSVFKGLKIGASALIKAGKAKSALAAVALENVAGDIAVTAAMDATGSVMAPADYAMSAVASTLLSLPSAPGVFRGAMTEAAAREAREIGERLETLRKETGDPATKQREIDDQIADIHNITTEKPVTGRQRVMDDEDIEAIRDEFEGKAKEDPEADPEAPPKPEPLAVTPTKPLDETPIKDVPPVVEPDMIDVPPLEQVVREDLDLPMPDGKLPKDLVGAKPRWKTSTIEFESDIDRALFITSQKTPSKADARYREWLRSQGLTDEDIRTRGLEVRAALKAADKGDGQPIKLGRVGQDKPDVPEVSEIPIVSAYDYFNELAAERKTAGDLDGVVDAYEQAIRSTDDEVVLKDLSEKWAEAVKARDDAKASAPLRLLEKGNATKMEFDRRPLSEDLMALLPADVVAGHKTQRTVQGTIREVLEAGLKTTNNLFGKHAPLMRAILERAGAALDTPVIFTAVGRGQARGGTGIISPATIRSDKATVGSVVKSLDAHKTDTIVHEIVHDITNMTIDLYLNPSTRAKLHPEVRNALEKAEGVLAKMRELITPAERAMLGDRSYVYAAKNLHELFSQAMVDTDTQKYLARIPATTAGGGRYSSMLQEVLGYLKTVLGLDSKRTALDEVHEAFDILLQVRDTATILDRNGNKLDGWGASAHSGPDAPRQQPDWSDPNFVQGRINAMKQPEWTKAVREYSDGALASAQSLVDLPLGFIGGSPEVKTNPKYAPAMAVLKDLAPKFLGKRARIFVGTGAPTGTNGIIMTAGHSHVIGLSSKQDPQAIARTAVHELGHAVYQQEAAKADPRIIDAMRTSYEEFLASVAAGNPDQVLRRYSVSSAHAVKRRVGGTEHALSFDEFTAEQFVKYVESKARRDGNPLGMTAKTRKVIADLIDRVKALFDAAKAQGHLEPEASFSVFFDDIVNRRGIAPVMEPAAGPVNPVTLPKARQAFAQRMYAKANQFLAANPIDRNKLRVITAKIGGMSDGLRLAASGNPILNMIASMVTETTTGAAGRMSNVAIRKANLQKLLTGNVVLDYQTAFDIYAKRNGAGSYDKFVSGNAKRAFDREVYLEILARRNRQASAAPKDVIMAADALEAMFERARKAQVDAQTLGSGNLPLTAEGYIPQALDNEKLADASPQDVAELQAHLATQFAETYNWTPQFSEDFANFYLQRSRARAMGAKGQDITAQSVDDTDLIRLTLEDMVNTTGNPALKQQAIMSKRGLGQTKKRLDVGLMTQLPSGKLVLDFYRNDPLDLARKYVNRTSGSVALMEYGIAGDVGIRQLREAVTNFATTQTEIPTQAELDAFDRVMAEISGLPIPGSVQSRAASNLRMFTGVQRLGSMAVAQFAETSNMIHHLGLVSLLKGIAQLPQMMGEVGRLKKGKGSDNKVLSSIETMGGEIGTEAYKMVMPLDPPDDMVGTYVTKMGLGSRLIAGGAHLSSKVSFFRGLLAAQHRMVAQQITMKALKYARDVRINADGTATGGPSQALIDMGFSVELIAKLQQDLHKIAKYDGNGELIELDITKLSHPDAAEDFVQAVTRGTSQIIQGTFIGERGAWAHNDYAKLLLQFRTFGLTAVEKQWGRTRLNNGYAYAAAVLLGQMAFALPLHLARVQLNAAGREDEKEYIKNNLHPVAVTKALMNYGSMSGMAGDVLDITAGLAGGWSGAEGKELLGANRNQSLSVGAVVPALGSIDQGVRAVSGNGTAYQALKQLPGSNLPFIIPFINLTK